MHVFRKKAHAANQIIASLFQMPIFGIAVCCVLSFRSSYLFVYQKINRLQLWATMIQNGLIYIDNSREALE